tara:strand:+ start:30874 stop:31935 length:1062 start_codon:yes stop_codon:yes gene_type:complete
MDSVSPNADLRALLSALQQQPKESGGEYYHHSIYKIRKDNTYRVFTVTQGSAPDKLIFKTYATLKGRNLLTPQKPFSEHTVKEIITPRPDPEDFLSIGLVCELSESAQTTENTCERQEYLIKACFLLEGVILNDAGQTNVTAQALYLLEDIYCTYEHLLGRDDTLQSIKEAFLRYHQTYYIVPREILTQNKLTTWVHLKKKGLYNSQVLKEAFSSKGGPGIITSYHIKAHFNAYGRLLSLTHARGELSFTKLLKRLEMLREEASQKLHSDPDKIRSTLYRERVLSITAAAVAIARKDKRATVATSTAVDLLEGCKYLLEKINPDTNATFGSETEITHLNKLIQEFNTAETPST